MRRSNNSIMRDSRWIHSDTDASPPLACNKEIKIEIEIEIKPEIVITYLWSFDELDKWEREAKPIISPSEEPVERPGQDVTVRVMSCGETLLVFFKQRLTCSETKWSTFTPYGGLNVTSYLPFFFSRLFIGSKVFARRLKSFLYSFLSIIWSQELFHLIFLIPPEKHRQYRDLSWFR